MGFFFTPKKLAIAWRLPAHSSVGGTWSAITFASFVGFLSSLCLLNSLYSCATSSLLLPWWLSDQPPHPACGVREGGEQPGGRPAAELSHPQAHHARFRAPLPEIRLYSNKKIINQTNKQTNYFLCQEETTPRG